MAERDASSFARTVLDHVDNGETEAFMATLAPDARFTVGSGEPAVGHDQILALLGGLFAKVQSTRHAIDRVHRVERELLVLGRCLYTFHAGPLQDIAYCDVWTLDDAGKIAAYEIYCDLRL